MSIKLENNVSFSKALFYKQLQLPFIFMSSIARCVLILLEGLLFRMFVIAYFGYYTV